MDSVALIRAQLEASAELKRRTAQSAAAGIAEAARILVAAFRAGNRLFLCGNGGSAADCQHLAAEFVNVTNRSAPRAPLSAIALTTDTSFLTASANDFGFEQVFARQVEAHGRPGDVLLAISTSGSSQNVLRALECARRQGLRSILLTGESASPDSTTAGLTIHVPSQETQRVQEAHIAIGHILCFLVERELFGEGGP